jgi:hypothetical protein
VCVCVCGCGCDDDDDYILYTYAYDETEFRLLGGKTLCITLFLKKNALYLR